MKKIIILLFLLCNLVAWGQKQANNWVLNGNILNFNTPIPNLNINTVFTITAPKSSISDQNGNLLFYCDGRTLYTRDISNPFMTNGLDLLGEEGGLGIGNSLIIPYPNDNNLYYVFINGGYANGLSYSIVDMRLNNGLGAVTRKNIKLTEKINNGFSATIGADCQSYWLVAHENSTDRFLAYKIDRNGINTTPVITQIGNKYGTGAMYKLSADGRKLMAYENNLVVYDFDTQTGKLSNRVFVTESSILIAEFSPDATKVYVMGNIGVENGIIQYDLQSVNVPASGIMIRKTVTLSILLASNGKIYTQDFSAGRNTLSVINQPNERGMACNYVTEAVKSQRDIGYLPAFPSNFVGGVSKDFTFSPICNSLAVKFSATSPLRNESYAWNFGDGSTSTEQNPTKTYTQAGNYTVTVKIGACTFTKNVIVQPLAKLTLPDSVVLCANESRSIGIAPQTGFSYQWTPQTGLSASNIANPTLRLANATDSTRKITYKLVVTNIANGCKDSALLPIKVRPALPAISAGKDTTICSGKAIQLGKNPPLGANLTYLWTPQTGLSATNTAQPTLSLVNTTTQPQKFTYILQATQTNCTVKDTVVVTVLPSMQPKIIGATAVCPFAQRMSYRLQTVGKSATLQWQVIGGTILNSSTPAGTGGLWLDSIVVNWQGENPKAMVKVWTINEFECIDSMTLNVKISPQAPALTDFGGTNRKICYGQTVMIGKPTLPQHTYWWSFSAAQGFSAVSTNVSSIPILNTNTSGQIIMTNAFVTVKNNATGCEYRDTVQLQLYPQLQVEAGKDTVVCSGTTLQLGTKPLPNANYRYLWKPALFLDNPQLAQPTAKFINTTTTAQVLDYELIASWDSCQVVDKVRITVLPQLPRYKVKGTAFVCPNVQQIGYKLDSLPANSGVKIRWVVRGGNLSLTAKTDSIHVNWGSTNTNAEVVAIVQAVTGCVDSFKLAVKILPELRPTLPTGSTKICWTADNLQTYTTNFTNGSVYEWHVEGGTLQSPQGKNSIAVRWNGVGQHRIWVTENSTTRTDICRGTSEKLTVNVLPTPLPKTIVGLTEICENEVQTTYRYDSETTSTYVWTVQGGEIVAGQGTQEIVVSWKNATQNALVKVQETNASGCKGQVQEQTIRINSTENCLVIPSLVSVGDAHFPYWHIKNIEKYPNNGLVVYNSLGQIVIQQNGYQNNYPLTHLSAGMYYYRLWVQSGERKISYAGKLVIVK